MIGASLIFWGAITDHLFIAAGLCLLIEGAYWIRLRWEFTDDAFIRAWQISIAMLALTVALIWSDGHRYTALSRLLVWLPVVLLPVQFVQSYGFRNTIPVHTFSFFARQRRERNLRLGLESSAAKLNFGNIYFITTLVACILGTNSNKAWFFPGVVLLTGWAFFSRHRPRLFPLVFAVLIAGCLSIGGQIGLRYLTNYLTGRGGTPEGNTTRTAIGSLGEIKQSPAILWRLKPFDEKKRPRLLRTASFNEYRGSSWTTRIKPDVSNHELDFQDLAQLETYRLVHPEADRSAFRPSLARFNLRGAAASASKIPLPGNAASLHGFELDGAERNSLGSVRIFPKSAIINGTVIWDDNATPESTPWDLQDTRIAENEMATLQQIAAETGLAAAPDLSAKLSILKNWMQREFRYTRYLSIPPPRAIRKRNGQYDPSPISIFLTTNRSGHCEYFATAAALLLRAVDVPTRYAVGFAVAEKDPKHGDFVLRGTHAHSWCRVWDEKSQTWIDFDPTPTSWINVETITPTRSQAMSDAFLRLREDFFLWRNRPENRFAASIVMTVIGLIAIGIVARRLWFSKKILDRENAATGFAESAVRTPLHELENLAEKILGPRPTGLPFSRYLRQLPQSPELDEAILLHQRLRFDPVPSSPQPVSRLQALVNSLKTGLTSHLENKKEA